MSNVFNDSYKVTFAPNALGHVPAVSSVKLEQGSHSQFALDFFNAFNQDSTSTGITIGAYEGELDGSLFQSIDSLNLNKNLSMSKTLAQATSVSVFSDLVENSEAGGKLSVDPDTNELTLPSGIKITLPFIDADDNFRVSQNEDDSVVVVTDIAKITYDKDGNRIAIEMGAFDPLKGTDGNDIIVNRHGLQVDSGDGDDTIFQLGASATINAGAGNDEVIFGDTTFDNLTVDLGDGDDVIESKNLHVNGELIIRAGNGNDSINIETLTAAKLTINGGEGNDSIQIGTLISPNHAVDGGKGNNSIFIGTLLENPEDMSV